RAEAHPFRVHLAELVAEPIERGADLVALRRCPREPRTGRGVCRECGIARFLGETAGLERPPDVVGPLRDVVSVRRLEPLPEVPLPRGGGLALGEPLLQTLDLTPLLGGPGGLPRG